MTCSRWLTSGLLVLAATGCLTLFDDDLPAPPADGCDHAGRDGGCTPRPEVCNGVDDDLDGVSDEGDEALCGPTPSGRSLCVEGACTAICDPGRHDVDGVFSNGCEYACVPSAGGAEACDGADNDCDGVADEELVGARVPGLTGVCAGARRRCEGAAGWGEADLDAVDGYELVEEACDGRDNDCDGLVDEAQPAELRCVWCDGDDLMPPCNGCPPGVVVPPGFVCIPPGEFTLGSDPDSVWFDAGEAPQQPVQVTRPLLMMETEVTQAAWSMMTGGNPALESPANRRACDAVAPELCPVERVSWFDAVWYANEASRAEGLPTCYDEGALERCTGTPAGGCGDAETGCDGDYVCDASFDGYDPACRGYRLPSEAEWEYAARAGTVGLFWFADDRLADVGQLEWIADAGALRPRPVGRGSRNPWGLYDMLGNVHEWVHAWSVPYPNPPPAVPHRDSLGLRPIGPDAERVYRGGSWFQTAQFARAAQRWSDPPARRDALIGLRLVRAVAVDAEPDDADE